MRFSRRSFLQTGSAALLSPWAGRLIVHAAAAGAKFRIGVTDWNIRKMASLEAFDVAKRIGFDGVQVSLGVGADTLPMADPERQQAYLAESKRVGLPIASTHMEILHRNYLKNDPLGQRWVADAIPITRTLGVKVILLPFFGKGALTTQAEMDDVGDVLREIAPAADKAGVILGLEDTISARDNVRIMERAKSPAVQVYYDVGNSTRNGFAIIEEIRWLGRERICEVHLKDNPHYLGEGPIDFRAVVDALADIGFSEWAQLETDSPTKAIEDDMRKNLQFIRGIVAERNKRS
jgi:sugar phosphate isomerase/epimerase